jgi:Mg2+ and Co2+ transporter CorA
VYDHVVTLLHRVEAASDMLVSLQNTYLANVQIDVAAASNESNLVMKNLTAVGAIILPLQLVASLWGMNCEVPFQAFLDWSDAEAVLPFISVCAAMLFVTLFMSAYFRKHHLM